MSPADFNGKKAKLTALLNEQLAKAEADLTKCMQAEFERRMGIYSESDGRHPKYDYRPPKRQRQFPTHQAYDHLVAMRHLED